MKKLMLSYLLFLFASNFIIAEMIVDKEGRRIILNEDKTWVYFDDMEQVEAIVLDGDIKGMYIGEIKDGKAHGYGVSKGKDTYEGEFKDGLKHGQGKYTWGRYPWVGDVYIGESLNGSRTGKGKYIYHTGTIVEGDFKDGKLNGQGKITDIVEGVKNVIEGEFINDRLTGKGKITTYDTNEIIIEGNFIDYKIEGESKYTNISTDYTIILEGNISYINTGFGVPALNGYGKLTKVKKDETVIFEGEFVNSIPLVDKIKITTIKPEKVSMEELLERLKNLY